MTWFSGDVDPESLFTIWERRLERGKDVPALENRPEIPGYLTHVFDAFEILNRRRNQHGAIPIAEMKSYIELRHPGMRLDERDEFIQMIEALDKAYLDEQNDGDDSDG